MAVSKADRDREWDADAAEKRVRRWGDAEAKPNAHLRDAYVWYDQDAEDEFESYKLPIADVIDGKLYAVPRAIMSAAGVMQGARGGIKLPKDDIDGVKAHLARYYRKVGETPPWDKD